MVAIGVKILVILAAATAAGAGVALFVIARQDGSKAGQVLGIALPVLTIIFALYLIL